MAGDHDFALVRRARGGDRNAFTQLVRAHQDRVFTLVRGIVGNPADAADVTQETFIAVLRHLSSFDERARFSTWLHRIAVRKAYDELRRRVPEPAEAATEAPDPHDTIETALQRSAVVDAINELDDGFREAVLLVDVLGCSIEEAAAVLDVATGTVKSRVFRARGMLATALGTQGIGGTSKQ